MRRVRRERRPRSHFRAPRTARATIRRPRACFRATPRASRTSAASPATPTTRTESSRRPRAGLSQDRQPRAALQAETISGAAAAAVPPHSQPPPPPSPLELSLVPTIDVKMLKNWIVNYLQLSSAPLRFASAPHASAATDVGGGGGRGLVRYEMRAVSQQLEACLVIVLGAQRVDVDSKAHGGEREHLERRRRLHLNIVEQGRCDSPPWRRAVDVEPQGRGGRRGPRAAHAAATARTPSGREGDEERRSAARRRAAARPRRGGCVRAAPRHSGSWRDAMRMAPRGSSLIVATNSESSGAQLLSKDTVSRRFAPVTSIAGPGPA